MDKNIKAVFDDVCSNLVIDSKLVKRISDYKTRFINRNSDHVAFFGGNLIGVHVIRFTPADRTEWFNDILECDESDLEDRLYSLPDVNPEFSISSDIFNLSCLWLTYALERNTKLSSRDKENGRFDTIMMLNIKLITSLMYHYFKYPADEEIARATYAELSYRFAIKQYGSWYKVMEVRTQDILDRKSIHYKTLKEFDRDVDINYMLNDVQGRLRDMVKNIYSVFMNIHAQGTRISTTSSILEHDGVEIFKDKVKSLSNYTRYILSVIPDKNSFMKEDLIQVIEKMIKTMPPKFFRLGLEWLSLNYGGKYTNKIDELVTETMAHAFDYLGGNRSLMRNTTDLPGLISKLKGTYMSSRNTDPTLKKIREGFEEIAKMATGSKNSNVIAGVRTGLMLYIVVRAISMKHYINR